MMVLVDTSVWSLAFRRTQDPVVAAATELAELIREGRAGLIGPVRQELLSGIKREQQFAQLRERLRFFKDVLVETRDFELAAEFYNKCRSKGIQGANTDFLISAMAARRGLPILTTDADFSSFAKVIPIRLHALRT